MSAMIISYIQLRRTTHKNCEHSVRNRKYEHQIYPHLLVYNICYYEYKIHT
jgi:hypothetical protein